MNKFLKAAVFAAGLAAFGVASFQAYAADDSVPAEVKAIQ